MLLQEFCQSLLSPRSAILLSRMTEEMEDRLRQLFGEMKQQIVTEIGQQMKTMEERLATKMDDALVKLESLEKRMGMLERSSDSPGNEVRLLLLILLYNTNLGDWKGDQRGSERGQ